MNRITSHKDRVAWQQAVALASKVYAATRQLPRDERFGLRAQLRRTAVSVASLIAAGSASQSRDQFVHSLQASRSSLAELETLFLIARQLAPLDDAQATLEEIAAVGRLLNALIRSLVSQTRTAHAKACAPQC